MSTQFPQTKMRENAYKKDQVSVADETHVRDVRGAPSPARGFAGARAADDIGRRHFEGGAGREAAVDVQIELHHFNYSKEDDLLLY
jgi:hypothetical protein